MESTAQNGVFMPKKKGRSVKIEEGGPLEDNVKKRADARREAEYRRGDKEALKILGRWVSYHIEIDNKDRKDS